MRIVGNSKLPVWIGNLLVGRPFAAWTYMIWVFVPGNRISPTVLHHESRHVEQFVWVTGVVLAAFGLFLRPAWYAYVLAVLLAHPLAVGVAGVVALVRGGNMYRDNWFERDARRFAGEE